MQPDTIVTIDGPVGSGKSTIGRMLAERHGLIYLDTGAMYRAVALEAGRRGVDPDDAAGLERVCADMDISFRPGTPFQRVFSSGEDVSDAIRVPEISMLASRVSAVQCVREAMVRLQRQVGAQGGIVVDGRDAGTVIFPQARFKFYLEAAIEERARRRYKELVEKKLNVVYSDLFNDIRKRDKDDSSRANSPLKPADDAEIIDTTAMSIEEVLQVMSRRITGGASSLS